MHAARETLTNAQINGTKPGIQRWHGKDDIWQSSLQKPQVQKNRSLYRNKRTDVKGRYGSKEVEERSELSVGATITVRGSPDSKLKRLKVVMSEGGAEEKRKWNTNAWDCFLSQKLMPWGWG